MTYDIDLVCECCGKAFTFYGGHGGRVPKYCSEACRNYVNNRRVRVKPRRRQEELPEPLPHKVWLDCESYAERQKAKTIELYGRVKI